ncbi:Holliday junction branch migration protein RuvA [Moraxella sp. Tifton1]|uniref:Holliday junction branch migration protein RuvA n=1 Tax=Moraxella oculi TaxID=2940516 RepID=UPI002013A343|nr:Holliday junction branch migration protein RuvA [Moraxella sp. Tifton1]MCL1622751.1 Holliday junction branch migration protein RuvA [Moraxella sp. Tifton1]
MIGLIKGLVSELDAPTVCVMTSSGIGYDIELPVSVFCQLTLNTEVLIYTHLHVREDAHLLYGFIKKQDRDVFRKLIKINGVGAKMALAMLSALSVDELKRAVEQNDDSRLIRIPGVGKKTAQRLIIELKGKLNEFGSVLEFGGEGEFFDTEVSFGQMHAFAEVESALIGLGYKEKEAQNAIKKAQAGMENVSTSQLLKASLRHLSGF